MTVLLNNTSNTIYNNFNASLIYDVLNNKVNKKEGYKRTKLYGSDAGYCPRKNFLNATEPVMERTEPLYLTLSQKVGYVIEDELLKLFDNVIAKSLRIPESEFTCLSGLAIDVNKVSKLILPKLNLNYSGIIDAIMVDENGNLAIIDVKTCGTVTNDKYIKVDSDGNDLEKPEKAFVIEPNYVAQLTFYAAVTGINSANLLYVSRLLTEQFGKNLAYRIEPIHLNDINIHSVLYRAYFSQLCIENNVLPIIPEEYHRGKTKYCKYCDHKANCYDGTFNDKYPSTNDHRHLYEQAKALADNFMLNRNDIQQSLRTFFGV
jgi:hypothetical protein